MKYSYNKICIFIIMFIVIVLFNSLIKKSDKIGFTNIDNNVKWSPDLIKRFNVYQLTVNDNITQFNLEQLQRQATPEEAEEYLKNGLWYWPDDLKQLYIEKVWENPIIKIDSQFALNYAMKIYNQNAARELLAWNTKEGQFLLYGGDLGVTDGIPKNMNNTIKCSDDNNSRLQKKIYTGMNLQNGYIDSKIIDVKNEDIPKEMPGFSFVKDPCNPCVALNSPGDFSCPFTLNINGDESISIPWKQLWNI